MMVAVNTRNSPAKGDRETIADILDVLSRRHPRISKSALKATGMAVAALTAATSRLSPAQQRQIAAQERALARAMENAVAELARPGKKPALVAGDKPVEISRGTGLGEILDAKDGRRRLADYATPMRLEDWASPVAGPGDIEKMFGTKRSTLHDWHKRGAVIGLLKGERKHVFPLAQFIDGRPVEGMAAVTAIIGNPRTAWLWLTRQHVNESGETPLDRLKAGRVEEVVADAEFDFVDDPEDVPADATPFDIRGVELSHHDGGCSFETILKKYEIDDPVMWEIGRIIHEADIGDEVYDAPEARGLDVLIRGLSMIKDDPELLDITGHVYEGLYEYLKRATVLGRDPS
jgi:hypothetical protein